MRHIATSSMLTGDVNQSFSDVDLDFDFHVPSDVFEAQHPYVIFTSLTLILTFEIDDLDRPRDLPTY